MTLVFFTGARFNVACVNFEKRGYTMSDYILTCGSTADLTKNYYTNSELPYIAFHYSIDGVEHNELDGSLSIEDFYSRMANGSDTSTSQINMMEFKDFFEPLAQTGKDIIHICFSSGLTGTINSAISAAEEIMEEYPGIRIKVVDSLSASSGYGLLMDSIVEKRDSGYTFDELVDYAEKERTRIQHWFYSTDLTFYKKGGRISAASYAVGTLLNIVPIMTVTYEGKLEVVEKERGRKKALKNVIEKMRKLADGGENYNGKCYISHAGCLEEAQTLATAVEEAFPNLKEPVSVFDIGTVIGSHTGPGTVALFYHGAEREI